MCSTVYFSWGNSVYNLLIPRRKTCVQVSTPHETHLSQTTRYPHTPQDHSSYPTTRPHNLSSVLHLYSPQLYTSFTQFPHPLLLRQRKKI